MTFPNLGRLDSSLALQLRDNTTIGAVGMLVIFASLGLGEAVYRLLYFEFDGATDRLPIEMMFGLAFAWMATKFVKSFYRRRAERRARIDLIREHNRKIREAVAAISPAPYAGNQQAIRVIREEVERIEWKLAEIAPR